MVARLVAALLVLLSSAAAAIAQQQPPSIPLGPAAPPRSIEPEPLPPLRSAPETTQSPGAAPSVVLPAAAAPAISSPISAAMSAPLSSPTGRVFCEQPVTVQLADPDAVGERYRPFIGIWSDASWTPLLCAALVVQNVAPDGTAAILYVFGPMGAGARSTGGVLQGTGVIRDGELRFQNSDGSQFAFRPLYADLDGRLTTPKDQSFHAVFKKTP
jgi:hypothetical protein